MRHASGVPLLLDVVGKQERRRDRWLEGPIVTRLHKLASAVAGRDAGEKGGKLVGLRICGYECTCG